MNYLNMLLTSCLGTTTTATTAADGTTSSGSSWYVIVIYIVIFAAIIYFMMIRPQKKQKKQQEQTMNSMEPGDSVLLTCGFYGTIVSVNGDTLIVEFGSNKNCRIPVSKQAVSQLEKANAASGGASADAAPVKKFGLRKNKEEAAQTEASSSSSSSSSCSSEQSSSCASEDGKGDN